MIVQLLNGMHVGQNCQNSQNCAGCADRQGLTHVRDKAGRKYQAGTNPWGVARANTSVGVHNLSYCYSELLLGSKVMVMEQSTA
jgi:hypothetical protein